MRQEFWIDRWAQDQIGFHRPDINPALVRYLADFDLKEGDPVLVPLCGKSLDLIYIAEQGFKVTGIELSDRAVRSFWLENDLTSNCREEGKLKIWESPSITLIEGDYFAVKPHHFEPPRLVYDRAALIAMPPEMRADYVHQLIDLAQGAEILLITLDYPASEMTGPPFPVSSEEVTQSFGTTHRIAMLESLDVLEDNASIKGRGVTSLKETVYRLSPN